MRGTRTGSCQAHLVMPGSKPGRHTAEAGTPSLKDLSPRRESPKNGMSFASLIGLLAAQLALGGVFVLWLRRLAPLCPAYSPGSALILPSRALCRRPDAASPFGLAVAPALRASLALALRGSPPGGWRCLRNPDSRKL